MKFEQIPIHVIGRRGTGQGTIRSFEHAKPDESVKDSLLLRYTRESVEYFRFVSAKNRVQRTVNWREADALLPMVR
jgi:hypothetical protein